MKTLPRKLSIQLTYNMVDWWIGRAAKVFFSAVFPLQTIEYGADLKVGEKRGEEKKVRYKWGG